MVVDTIRKGHTDKDLLFKLESITFAEGVPLHRMINYVEMPDGRLASEWVKERPDLQKRVDEILELEATIEVSLGWPPE